MTGSTLNEEIVVCIDRRGPEFTFLRGIPLCPLPHEVVFFVVREILYGQRRLRRNFTLHHRRGLGRWHLDFCVPRSVPRHTEEVIATPRLPNERRSKL